MRLRALSKIPAACLLLSVALMPLRGAVPNDWNRHQLELLLLDTSDPEGGLSSSGIYGGVAITADRSISYNGALIAPLPGNLGSHPPQPVLRPSA